MQGMMGQQFFLFLCTICAAFCIWLTVQIVNRPERWVILTAVNAVVVIAAFAGFWRLLSSVYR